MRINLVSGPRNISTALMYSFAQRTDTTVLDEPFYAVYLKKTGVNHPGRDEVLRALPGSEPEVRSLIDAVTTPVVFIKNMAHHMEVLETPFVKEAVNVFLIRDPRQILSSYAQVIERPTMRDIGVAYQYQLFKQLVSKGETPLVVDSGLVSKNPAGMLAALCNGCGISFQPAMLSWSAGPKPYDGAWAPHWYANVHRSTGFERRSTATRPLPPHLKGLDEEARSFYEKLLPFSIKA